MKAVLFNIHDLVLLLTIGACGLLGSMHLVGWRHPKWAGYLFGLFFAANALVALNTLIFWAEPVRYPIFAVFPYLYLLLSAVGFLLGPLLYWQLKAHLNPGYRPQGRQYLHLLPAVLAVIYLYAECFRFPDVVRRDLFLNLQIYHQPYAFYGCFITLGKVLPIVYAAACVRLFRCQPGMNESCSSGAEAAREQGYMVGGFLTMWLWAALTHFVGTAYPGSTSDAMGIVGNYFKLGFVVFLICRELRHSFQSVDSKDPASAEEVASIDERHVERVARAMTQDKIFLNPQLTLERFAQTVQCSPREVSVIINKRFRKNFNEFVSGYRIEEVKSKLRDPAYSEWTIPRIAQAAGFNSKATFHRLFKKVESTTPSVYRKMYGNNQHVVEPVGTASQNA